MMELRHRASRIERIRSVDESKLAALSAELAAIDVHRVRLEEHHAEIQSQIESLSEQLQFDTVGALQNRLGWSAHLQNQCVAVQRAIDEVNQQREAQLSQVVNQKKVIRGWDHLLEQIDTSLKAEMQQIEAAEADDAYLMKRNDSK